MLGERSHTHPYFTQKSEERQRRQIRITNITVREVTGTTTKPWFRFPFGDYDAAAIAVANSMGYATIGWTVDSLGWQGTSGGRTKRSTRQRVVAAARPGAIVLMRGGANPKDGTTLDADALPSIIRKLREKGYELTELVTPGG